MAKCGGAGGYDNPAVGLWGVCLSAQAVVALILLLVAASPHLPKEPTEDAAIAYVNAKTFAGLGTAHLITCMAMTALVFIGYFCTACFQLPLWICAILFQILCLVTSGFTGSMLTSLDSKKSSVLDEMRQTGKKPGDVVDFSEIFVDEHAGMLLAVAVLGLLMPVFISQAKSKQTSTPGHEATLYPAATIISLASAGIFLFCRASSTLAGLSSAWLIVGAVITISVSIQQCCCSRVLSIVLAAIFALGAVFAVISAAVVGKAFESGRHSMMLIDSKNPSAVPVSRLDDNEFETFKIHVLAGDGVYLLIGFCFNVSAFVFFVYSALAAFRSMCALGRKTSVATDESDNA
ncbi:hypothetical protein BESB_081430 [Besnoitia besnoiti]|uniref:Transmembrane protein n=1 Tax=Besnoitia besnoiti TaxID=94643 RepID=A0A2A9M6X6_BESBE|nr:hypothetical protein BESB_081430 [Besnoitia besnoiti]PFH32944.1 hypothetical protein BESB_081430 [Besnoitia besnoiti]